MNQALKKAATGFMLCFFLLLLNEGMAQTTKSKSLFPIEKDSMKLETLQLKVDGMSCQAGCANGIDNMLGGKTGILESWTSFDAGSTEIQYDKSKISEKEIIDLIEERGFRTEVIKELK